jgi:competence protein ComER
VNVGFIGMGNMGQMLVKALVRARALSPGEVMVSNRSPAKLEQIAAAVPGICIAYANQELARQCQVIFLCVKPGETRAVLDAIRPYITPEHLVVAITNTLTIPALEEAVPARIAKVIPSLLHAIGEGVSLLMFGERCTPADHAVIHRLMGAISRPQVIQESQARVASDLTSCGPAFLSFTWRALAQAAGRHQPDLPPDAIAAMIRETALATARLMEQTGLSCDDIIARVSTPGGVTAEGIQILAERLDGVWEQVIATTIRTEDKKKARVIL